MRADIIVNDELLLEIKSVRQIIKVHEAQLVKILVAKKIPPATPELATRL